MIHIATVHWNMDDYKDIQYRHIYENVAAFQIWAFVDGTATITDIDRKRYFFCERADAKLDRNHCGKLDALADIITKGDSVIDDDILLFMDGDAWPVQPITHFIHDTMKRYGLAAVIRPENGGDNYAHPCFCFTTIRFWKEHKLTWKPGPTNSYVYVGRVDGGGTISKYLNDNNIEWLRMTRSKSLGEHVLLFGVYDNKVYHHCAGFRDPITMIDRIMPEKAVKREFSLQILQKLKNNELSYF